MRVRIRKVLNLLEKEGLNFNKFKITLDNLYKSNLSVDYYVDSNIKKNSKFINNQKILIINKEFFNNADEIVFRSFSQLVHKFGNKKNYARGTKITNLVKNIQNNKNFKKMTLSGCIFEKVNNSIIISREI